MKYQLPIIEKKEVAKDTTEITFGTEGHEIAFKAGQYVSLTLPELLFPDTKGPSRFFSAIFTPYKKDSISIAFRNSPSGFKKTLLALPMGSKVEVECCHGAFILPEETSRPIILIAGGIGITPCLSMIRVAVKQKNSHHITLVYGNHDQESSAYLTELESLAAQNPNFILKTIFGRLDQVELEKNIEFNPEAEWFVVGPSIMVESVSATLQKNDVPDTRIHTEEFSGYNSLFTESTKPSLTTSGEYEASEIELHGILNTLNKTVLIAVTDSLGIITYVNDLFVSISKYSREELIGQNHRILKSGEHTQEFYEKLWSTISSGEIWRGEIKNKAKDGTYYWVDASIAPLFNETGEIIRFVAARFLITEKRNLKKKQWCLLALSKEPHKHGVLLTLLEK